MVVCGKYAGNIDALGAGIHTVLAVCAGNGLGSLHTFLDFFDHGVFFFAEGFRILHEGRVVFHLLQSGHTAQRRNQAGQRSTEPRAQEARDASGAYSFIGALMSSRMVTKNRP